MKTSTKISLILLLALNLNTITFSQSRNVAQKNGVFNNNLEFFALLKVKTKHNNEFSTKADGNFYLNKKWNKCVINTTDNKKYTFNSCNYNVYDKRMEIFAENEILFIKKEIIQEIIIQKHRFKPFNSDINEINYKYYEDLAEKNNVKLIQVYSLKKKTIPSKESLGIFVNTVEVKSKKYFIIDNKFIEVPKSKTKVLKLLKKENNKKLYKKINVRKIKDLIFLVQSL